MKALNRSAGLRLPLFHVLLLSAATLPLAGVGQPGIAEALRTGDLDLRKPGKPAAKFSVRTSAQSTDSEAGSVRFLVKRVVLRGLRSIEESELRSLIDTLEGKESSLADLEKACSRITDYYRRHGYFLARAFLPEQEVSNGTITIEITEAWLEFINIDNSSPVSDGMLRRKMGAITVGDVLTTEKIESAIASAGELAGVTLTDISLSPGLNQGATTINVTALPTGRLTGAAYLDNYGSLYTGKNRLGYNVAYASPFGRGDMLTLAGVTTEKSGLSSYLLRYDNPINSRSDVSLTLSRTTYTLGESYASLDAHGVSDSIDTELSHTLLQGAGFKHSLTAGLGHRKLKDEIGSTALVTPKQDTYATVAYAFRRDHEGLIPGAKTKASVKLTGGSISFRDAAARSLDASGSMTQGAYQKVEGILTHEFVLDPDFSLLLSIRGQQTLNGKNMDGSQKIGLSGSDGVRAYSSSELMGDNGYLIRSELRLNSWTRQRFALLPFLFVDKAHSSGGNASSAVTSRSISDLGLGLTATGESWRLNLELAHRLESDPALSEPTAENRLLARLAYFF
ncbi:MAG: ShlB/FhaC/HecB family hemolysin secretion/activation protein [Opitutales bacterium]